jgi:DNA-binding NtrC family response regulator
MLTSHSNRNRRVLITVEDSTVLNMLMVGLERQNCYPVAVKDGYEVQRVLSQDSNFCGAIFDMRILSLRELNVLGYMHANEALTRIPIMMLAAERDFRYMAKDLAAGVSVFLSTPFTLHCLQSTLRLLVRSNT